MAKIALEATRANKLHKTGTEWYAWHLLQQFKRIDRDNQYTVYYNQELAAELKQGPANFLFKQLYFPKVFKLWTHLRLGPELVLNPPDKFLATNAVPFISRGELIVTIHDLGFLNNPELYHPLERIYQKLSHQLAIRRADKIIAVSEATALDIKKFFPKAKSPIKVIYHGWDKDCFRPAQADRKIAVKQKFNLADKYLLYVGRLETKKNIQNLLKAFRLLVNQDWQLVLAGRPGNFGYEEILALATDPRIKDRVKILGYVSQTDYQDLLASASIFIFPSKFEGFGIPLLEAMGSGVPILASDIPVLREVGGQAVLYFNPDNPQQIAEQIDKLILSSALQEELVRRGLKRSQEFSWEKCAKETLEFILE